MNVHHVFRNAGAFGLSKYDYHKTPFRWFTAYLCGEPLEVLRAQKDALDDCRGQEHGYVCNVVCVANANLSGGAIVCDDGTYTGEAFCGKWRILSFVQSSI